MMPTLEHVLFIPLESDDFGHISSRDLFAPCYKSARAWLIEGHPELAE